MKTLIAALLLAVPFAANAVIIDFEGVIPAGSSRTGDPIFPYTEDGFRLSDVDSGVSNALFGPTYGVNDNGTDILGWLVRRAFSIASIAADPFDLLSLDLATLSGEASTTYTITGLLAGGGSIGTAINATNVWTTFNLGWTNLTSVVIRAGATNGAIDNINVVAHVPEPGTLALLGLGMFGIGLARRRRNA